MTEELKPCPFCGSTELDAFFHRVYGRIECQRCEAVLPLPEKSEEMQRAAWNTRAATPTGITSGATNGEG